MKRWLPTTFRGDNWVFDQQVLPAMTGKPSVWRSYINGGWAAFRPGTGVPAYGFETPQEAARYALGIDGT